MEDLAKVRVVGCVLCLVVQAGFAVVTYSYWTEWSEVTEDTRCKGWEGIYQWEVAQHGLWMMAVGVLLWVLAKPEKYRFLLISLYLLGPVFFIWTVAALFSLVSFHSCCSAAHNNCIHSSSYQGGALVYGQMMVSLLMSGLISLALFCILACVSWSYLDKRIQESIHRLHSPEYSLIV